MKFLENLIKNNILFQKIYIILGTIFFRLVSLFVPLKKNLILFSSMSGNNYENSSPFLIYQKINSLYGDAYEYIWAFSKKQKATEYKGKRVKIDSFRYFIYVLKAHIWITDVNIERGLRLKRKKQYYVNTWHGGITKGYPKTRKDYKLSNVNIFCSDGAKYEEFFTEHYKVNKYAYLRCGRPREDSIFCCEQNRIAIRAKFGFSDEDFIILYMPTWRENKDARYLDLSAIVNGVPNAKAVFHSHNLSNIAQLSGKNVIDLSDVSDLNSLYAAADLLISDYSSCIYDFLLLDKPVLLFANDYDEYSSTRGLAVDLKSSFPFSVSATEDELIEKINIIKNGYDTKEYRDFLHMVVDIDRKQSATEAIIQKMKQDGELPYEY